MNEQQEPVNYVPPPSRQKRRSKERGQIKQGKAVNRVLAQLRRLGAIQDRKEALNTMDQTEFTRGE